MDVGPDPGKVPRSCQVENLHLEGVVEASGKDAVDKREQDLAGLANDGRQQEAGEAADYQAEDAQVGLVNHAAPRFEYHNESERQAPQNPRRPQVGLNLEHDLVGKLGRGGQVKCILDLQSTVLLLSFLRRWIVL